MPKLALYDVEAAPGAALVSPASGEGLLNALQAWQGQAGQDSLNEAKDLVERASVQASEAGTLAGGPAAKAGQSIPSSDLTTIAGKAYAKAAEDAYATQAENDITDKSARLAQEHEFNPTNYVKATQEYLSGMTSKLDARTAARIKPLAERVFNRTANELAAKQTDRNRAKNGAEIETWLANTVLPLGTQQAHDGDVYAIDTLAQAHDRLDSAVLAGEMTADRAETWKRKLGEEMRIATYRGDFYNAPDKLGFITKMRELKPEARHLDSDTFEKLVSSFETEAAKGRDERIKAESARQHANLKLILAGKGDVPEREAQAAFEASPGYAALKAQPDGQSIIDDTMRRYRESVTQARIDKERARKDDNESFGDQIAATIDMSPDQRYGVLRDALSNNKGLTKEQADMLQPALRSTWAEIYSGLDAQGRKELLGSMPEQWQKDAADEINKKDAARVEVRETVETQDTVEGVLNAFAFAKDGKARAAAVRQASAVLLSEKATRNYTKAQLEALRSGVKWARQEDEQAARDELTRQGHKLTAEQQAADRAYQEDKKRRDRRQDLRDEVNNQLDDLLPLDKTAPNYKEVLKYRQKVKANLNNFLFIERPDWVPASDADLQKRVNRVLMMVTNADEKEVPSFSLNRPESGQPTEPWTIGGIDPATTDVNALTGVLEARGKPLSPENFKAVDAEIRRALQQAGLPATPANTIKAAQMLHEAHQTGSPANLPRPDVAPGNIDLTKRPVVHLPNGSIATVKSKSFNFGGIEVLIPTVSPEGKMLSDKEAVALYRRTGQHLGKFKTPAAATAYAKKLHEQQAEYYRGR